MQQKPEDEEPTEYDEDGKIVKKKVTFTRKVEKKK